MTLQQAQALARRAFVRLWESGEMTPRQACVWLLHHLNVERVEDLGSVAQCERFAELVVRWWAERNASKCPTCRVPVRLDHAHVIATEGLFHLNCITPHWPIEMDAARQSRIDEALAARRADERERIASTRGPIP